MVYLAGIGQSPIFVAQHQTLNLVHGLVNGLAYIVVAIGVGYMAHVVTRVAKRHGFIGIYDILTFAWALALAVVFLPGVIFRIMPGFAHYVVQILANVGGGVGGSVSVALFFLVLGLGLARSGHKMRQWKDSDDERYRSRLSHLQ